MRKILGTTITLSLIACAALGNGSTHHNNNDNSHHNNNSTNEYNSSSVANPVSNSTANGGDQRQIGINKSDNDSNSTSTSEVSNNTSDSNSIQIGGAEAPDIPVNTAYAPLVISTSDCLGSLSVGGQGQFLGFSIGGTKQSKPCNIREYSKMFEARKQPDIAFAILCQDPIVKRAVETTGESCPSVEAAESVRRREVCKYPTAQCKAYKRFN